MARVERHTLRITTLNRGWDLRGMSLEPARRWCGEAMVTWLTHRFRDRARTLHKILPTALRSPTREPRFRSATSIIPRQLPALRSVRLILTLRMHTSKATT